MIVHESKSELRNSFELGLFDQIHDTWLLHSLSQLSKIITSQSQRVQFSLNHLGHYNLRVQWYNSVWISVLMYSLDDMIANIHSVYSFVEFILNLSYVQSKYWI
jgi:hypothetical protein